ncbi:hypothetical protein MNBD_ALPHA06-835 [hydrothermal vent metagenome]|uniref:Magnesium transporter MgtE intracellular domain-containing protein n=1 Tax=hydrothermal vent metagenome TaxID=652676 RepID=A0A3B0RZ69_9ZZZZ
MSIRIFAVLAILATGLIAIKVLSITDEIITLLDPSQPAWAASAAKKEKKSKKTTQPKPTAPNITAEAKPAAETQVCKALSFAEQAGLSEQELRVVLRLSQRREELDVRDRSLKTREAVIALSEKQLDNRLARIDAAIAKYDQRIGMLDEQEEARMAAVVKTYETMKPKSAATIFNTLNERVLLQLASRMKPQAMAKVLAAMDTARASNLTVRMSEQFVAPTSAEALMNGENTNPEG